MCLEVLSDCWSSAGLCSASGDVSPLKMVISIPFCLFLFSLYLYPLSAPAPFLYPLSAPFLNPSLFSLSLFPLASPPSLLSLLINSPSSKDKDFKFNSVSLLSKAPLACGSSALPSLCYLNYSSYVNHGPVW